MPIVEHKVRPAELVTDHLETPFLDSRTYRVIRLPNQLEALLVHDAQTVKASASMDVNVGNFSDESARDSFCLSGYNKKQQWYTDLNLQMTKHLPLYNSCQPSRPPGRPGSRAVRWFC